MEVTTIIGDIQSIGAPSKATGRVPDGSGTYEFTQVRFQVKESPGGSTRLIVAGGGLAQLIPAHLKNGQVVACTMINPDSAARYGTPMGRVMSMRALSGVSEEAFNRAALEWENYLFFNIDGSDALKKSLSETLELLQKQKELNVALSSRNKELELLLSIVNEVAPR